MFNKLLIVGCGLIGSSILRASIKKKIAKKYFVYEKSIKNNSTIKKINSKVILLKKLDHNISDIDFIILSTPMSSYSRIITSLNKFLTNKAVITDVGSTKKNVLKLKRNQILVRVFFNYLIFLAKSLALNQASSTLGPLNQSPQTPNLYFLFQ